MKKIYQAPPKTAGEKIREQILITVITMYALYLIKKFFDTVFGSLNILSEEEREYNVLKQIQEKRFKRKERSDFFKEVAKDPMNQFYLRFIEDPDKYKDDPDSAYFKEWFESWKKGEIIDSNLKWAPDCLENNSMLNESFIEYMKIQLDLHKKSGLINKAIFLKTILDFYPELNPTLKGLEKDLYNYQSEKLEARLRNHLKELFLQFGLTEDIANYLSNKDEDSEKRKKDMLFCESLTQEGISSETCIYSLENNLNDLSTLKLVDKVVKDFSLPPRVGAAYINNEILIENLLEISTDINRFKENIGIDIFIEDEDGKSFFDTYIDDALKSFKEKLRSEQFSRRV